LKGRVFDILGEVFEDTSLKDLLMQAIRYGDSPEVRARRTLVERERVNAVLGVSGDESVGVGRVHVGFHGRHEPRADADAVSNLLRVRKRP
jgi:hypothetical protein